MGMRWIFDGHIAGIGTASGLRAVVGLWQESPFGPFADAMVQLSTGRRILLARPRRSRTSSLPSTTLTRSGWWTLPSGTPAVR
jgi:hypothetical protein